MFLHPMLGFLPFLVFVGVFLFVFCCCCFVFCCCFLLNCCSLELSAKVLEMSKWKSQNSGVLGESSVFCASQWNIQFNRDDEPYFF